MTTTSPTEPTTRTKTPRDPLWDNARWIAITLVVVGHAIEVPSSSDLAFGLYLVIYTFHMPLFAFVSGRFSKSEITAREARGILTQIVLPLVIFQTVWLAFSTYRRDGDLRIDYITPSWLLWFLLALALWRLSLPLFALMRHPFLVSLAVAVVAGFSASSGTIAATSRTLTFLPFFVAGWCLHERGGLEAVRRTLARPTVRVAAAVILVGAVVLAVTQAELARELMLRKWVQGEQNFDRLGYVDWWAGLVRVGVTAAAFLFLFCALAVTPRRRTFMTPWGGRTMNVYMLHLFPIVIASDQGWISRDRNSTEVIIGLVVLAVVWSMVLSTKAVDVLFGPLTHPKATWLLLPSEAPGRRRTSRT